MPWNSYYPIGNLSEPSWNVVAVPPPIQEVMSGGSINNIIPNDASFVGLFYAYNASGGFVMEQGIANTVIVPYEQINRYDMTNTLQVAYDVRVFNEKIGLYKDSQNITVLESSYNNLLGSFPTETITLSATEFSLAMQPSNIISVGFYNSLYSNFIKLLNAYFGFPQGFNSLFSIQSQIDINNGVFDASAMVNLMNYT